VNGHYKNIEFKCADVTSPELKIPRTSIDLVFSNWLLMYLSDEEVEITPDPSVSLSVSLSFSHLYIMSNRKPSDFSSPVGVRS
jgi:hypothetical protein